MRIVTIADKIPVSGCDENMFSMVFNSLVFLTTFLPLRRGSLIIQNQALTYTTYRFPQINISFFFKAKLAEQHLSNRTKLLEMRENATSLTLQQQTVLLQQELNKMSNRGKIYKVSTMYV